MSESRFPNPRTSVFNPLAWDFTLLDKYANFIVAYRYAQSYPIFFGGSPTLTTRTALTQWADTAYATAQISAWVTANVTPILGTAQVWAILQYYFGGIAVNTINPLMTGGTLRIGHSNTTNQVSIHSKESRSTVLHLGDGNTSAGGIHINNGTNTTGNVNILNGTGSTGILTLGSSTSTTHLHTALEPNYTFPIATGKIGYIVPLNAPITNTLTGVGSLRSVTLPSDGIWVMCANILGQPNLTYPDNFYGISITSGINNTGTPVGIQKTGQQVKIAPAPSPSILFSSSYFVASRLTAATYYLNMRCDNTYTVSDVTWIVMRLA